MVQAAISLPSNSPKIKWEEFLENWGWQQGEHVTLLGPTGSGKTTLTLQILPKRKHVVVFATKRRDDTLKPLVNKMGFKVIEEWPPTYKDGNKILLWPDISKPEKIVNQQEVFRNALRDIYSVGAWTVVLDEVRYLTEYLRLQQWVELLWQQGRSMGVSLVAGTQRPAKIPLTAYDQISHLFMWKDQDKRNLQRMAEISGNDEAIRATVPTLKPHEVLYLGTRSGTLARTMVNRTRARL